MSRALRSARVQSVLLCRTVASGPWGVRVPTSERAAFFHAVLRGSAALRSEKTGETLTLEGGDLLLLTRDNAHVLSDLPGREAMDLGDPQELARDGCPSSLELGPAGPDSTLALSGCFIFEAPELNPLRAALPLVIRIRNAPLAPMLKATLTSLDENLTSVAPGAIVFRERLTEMLLVLALQAHFAATSEASQGWLDGLLEPRLGAALLAIQEAPEAPWTVERLAKVAAMSRSSFAELFARKVGEGPMRFVTRWRMFRAALLLRQPEVPLKEVAARVGIEDPAIFSRMFRKWARQTPSEYRKAQVGVAIESVAAGS